MKTMKYIFVSLSFLLSIAIFVFGIINVKINNEMKNYTETKAVIIKKEDTKTDQIKEYTLKYNVQDKTLEKKVKLNNTYKEQDEITIYFNNTDNTKVLLTKNNISPIIIFTIAILTSIMGIYVLKKY